MEPWTMSAADAARFWSKVEREGGPAAHWLWLGRIGGSYATFNVGGQTRRVQLIAFELEGGTIPPGGKLLQRCRVRGCVNPAHWQLVAPIEEPAPAR